MNKSLSQKKLLLLRFQICSGLTLKMDWDIEHFYNFVGF